MDKELIKTLKSINTTLKGMKRQGETKHSTKVSATTGYQLKDIAKKLRKTYTKLSTVKIIRDISGLGLKESKDIVDNMYAGWDKGEESC